MPEKEKHKTKRLTRQQWLEKSLELLSKGGPGQLRIDNITKKMKVTKGSFYWHFRNRADYIESLAHYWDKWSNDDVIKYVEAMDATPKAKMKSIITHVIENNLSAYDAAVQMLAHGEPKIAPIIAGGFMKRLKFLGSLFRQAGFKGKTLETHKRLFVGYFILDAVLIDRESKKERLQHALNMLDFITQK
jgi:AcrR family transcriptional regulator